MDMRCEYDQESNSKATKFEVVVSKLLSELMLNIIKNDQDKSDQHGKNYKILKRQFIQVNFSSPITQDVQKDSMYRVMQWNMLAQALSSTDNNFIRCPAWVVNWSRRQYSLIYEMLRCHPDVICLEEVDHFEYLEQTLSRVGYRGLFNPKVSSPCLEFSENNGPDGCAIFYRTDRLQCLSRHPVVLHCSTDQESHEAVSTSAVRQTSTLKTSQVALVVEFSRLNHDNVHGNGTFWVCATHLKAKSSFSDVRARQARWLLDQLNLLRKGAPLILCGDFNAAPSEPVIREVVNLSLQSAYPETLNSDQESCQKHFTTWKFRGRNEDSFDKHVEVCHAIDYIWYTEEHWKLCGHWSLPSKDDIGSDGLPCVSYPSDHLALCADFLLL